MPTYEYLCTSCAEPLEAYQSFTDPPLEECDKCGGRLRRVFSPVAISFKGSGFYSTDARAQAKAKKDGEKPDSKGQEKASKGEGGQSKGESGQSKNDKPSADSKPASASSGSNKQS